MRAEVSTWIKFLSAAHTAWLAAHHVAVNTIDAHMNAFDMWYVKEVILGQNNSNLKDLEHYSGDNPIAVTKNLILP